MRRHGFASVSGEVERAVVVDDAESVAVEPAASSEDVALDDGLVKEVDEGVGFEATDLERELVAVRFEGADGCGKGSCDA